MARYIVTRRLDNNTKTNFAGFIDRGSEEATKKWGGPFIDYATKLSCAKVFDNAEEAHEAIFLIGQQLHDALQTHKVEAI
jgi:hypothetical protein